MDAIYHRTSIRKYQDKSVEREKIEAILRAAMQAPSAKNQQPWEFYVVTIKETLACPCLSRRFDDTVHRSWNRSRPGV